ncbi:MAG: sensor histidine kinase [Bacillota bacterium]
MKTNKNLSKYFLIFLMLIIISTGCTQQTEKNKLPEAANGKLDLSFWDLEEDGIIYLKGNWEFYWEKLISPKEFVVLKENLEGVYINVPDAWNDYNPDIKREGFATYRLVITNINHEVPLGLDIPRISSSYKLWVNGNLLTDNGEIGITAEKSIPQSQPKTVFFNPEQDEIELILQISNFHHRNGGILENIKLGTEKQIKLAENWFLAFDLFVFGSLFVMGIYHLLFYFFRRKEISNLFFGAFCTIIGIRTLFVGRIFIFNLFPNIGWEAALKVEYLTFYLGTPLFILYLKSLLPREITNNVVGISIFISTVFSAIVLFNPVKYYAKYNILFQFYVIITILYLLYALFLACLRKRNGAIAISLAVVFFVSTIINDILYESSLIYLNKSLASISISSWGFLVFVFSQSMILSRKFTRAFSRIEEMTVNLQQLNEHLEDKVSARTIALEYSKKELEKAYEDLSAMEKSRTELLTNISHDLRSPMTSILGYANAINDGIVEDPEQIKKYLMRIKEKINGLNHLSQELFDLTQLESKNIKLEVKTISVGQLIQMVYKKYLLDVSKADINFKLSSDISSLSSHLVKVDMGRIDRAFANIIYNAINFTPKGGTISLDFNLNDLNNPTEIIIKFSDNGSGISENDLPHVFNRFFTGSKSRTSKKGGSGLGLAITKEIVEYHNGRVWVTSKPGYETTFYVALPLCT